MNREILRLALPNIIANITVPILGMTDTAISGHLSSSLYIGAIAASAVIFNFLYWNFSFLRMGTSGFTAQALGARDLRETAAVLCRSLFTAVSAGAVLIILQSLIFEAAFFFLKASPEIKELSSRYFYIYIWSAPFALAMFAFSGWFIGMQNAKAPMVIAISANLANIAASLIFVFVFDMEIKGIALGSLAAQIFSCALAAAIWLKYYGKLRRYISLGCLKSAQGFKAFFKVNRDIFIRSFGLIMVTVFFTGISARRGDIFLAANSLLMQLFLLFSYIMDGFAFAAEALSGKYYGAKNYLKLIKIVKRIFLWGFCLSCVFALLYLGFTGLILNILTDKAEVIAMAMDYKYWAALIPFAGFAAFLWDGVFVGITAARQMRNSMLFAAAAFFALYLMLEPKFGNNALWLAFLSYLSIRGLAQFLYFGKIKKRFK